MISVHHAPRADCLNTCRGLMEGGRGCTLDGYKILKIFKGRKSVMLGVWVAPMAPETLPKDGRLRPPPFGRVSGAPGAAQTPDLRPVNKFTLPSQSAATRKG